MLAHEAEPQAEKLKQPDTGISQQFVHEEPGVRQFKLLQRHVVQELIRQGRSQLTVVYFSTQLR